MLLTQQFGSLSRACDQLTKPMSRRKIGCRTLWPMPVIAALAALVKSKAGKDLFQVSSAGVLVVDKAAAATIGKLVDMTATFTIDGKPASAWEVWTERHFSVAVGNSMESEDVLMNDVTKDASTSTD